MDAEELHSNLLLEIRSISKTFGGVRALDSVSFNIRRGETLALVGANGAGKSTLIRLLAGAERPDSGEFVFAGRVLPEGDPKATHDHGLAFIYQDPVVVQTMTVGENIVLGHEIAGRFGVLAPVRQGQLTEATLRILGGVKLDARVSDLSSVEQQLVAIARAVSERAYLFVMDEPTAALSEAEVEKLFSVIHELVDRGSSVLYVSHRLEELHGIADRFAVLRDGRLIFEGERTAVSVPDLVQFIVGRKDDRADVISERPCRSSDTEELIRVSNLTLSGQFDNVSFAVHENEVVALLGLVDAGQVAVVRAISGASKASSGAVVYPNGEVGVADSPADGLRRGVSLLPQSRAREGIFPRMSVKENLLVSAWCSPAQGSFERSSHWETLATDVLERLDVYPKNSQDSPIQQLSGGNQQKVLLGRVLLSAAPVLLLEEPTGGVDVGSKPQLHGLITSIARQGRGVIVASSDPEEILPIADRIIVFFRGRVVGEKVGSQTTKAELLHLSLGVADS